MVQSSLNQTDKAFKQVRSVNFNDDLVNADQVISNSGKEKLLRPPQTSVSPETDNGPGGATSQLSPGSDSDESGSSSASSERDTRQKW